MAFSPFRFLIEHSTCGLAAQNAPTPIREIHLLGGARQRLVEIKGDGVNRKSARKKREATLETECITLLLIRFSLTHMH